MGCDAVNAMVSLKARLAERPPLVSCSNIIIIICKFIAVGTLTVAHTFTNCMVSPFVVEEYACTSLMKIELALKPTPLATSSRRLCLTDSLFAS